MRELGCVSDLALDEWSAGELSAARASEVQAHLQQCARCRERHTDHEREHAAFLDAAPSVAAHAALIGRIDATGRARWRPALWLGTALAAAAALAFVSLAPPASAPGTRTKGAPHVDFFVKRGARVTRHQPGELLRAGDLLRFTVSSEHPRYLALLDHDPRGARIYYPSGERAVALPAGSAVPLDFSIELDDSGGPERVYAVFCPEPFTLEPLRAELARAGALRAPDGCQLDVLEIRKEPQP